MSCRACLVDNALQQVQGLVRLADRVVDAGLGDASLQVVLAPRIRAVARRRVEQLVHLLDVADLGEHLRGQGLHPAAQVVRIAGRRAGQAQLGVGQRRAGVLGVERVQPPHGSAETTEIAEVEARGRVGRQGIAGTLEVAGRQQAQDLGLQGRLEVGGGGTSSAPQQRVDGLADELDRLVERGWPGAATAAMADLGHGLAHGAQAARRSTSAASDRRGISDPFWKASPNSPHNVTTAWRESSAAASVAARMRGHDVLELLAWQEADDPPHEGEQVVVGQASWGRSIAAAPATSARAPLSLSAWHCSISSLGGRSASGDRLTNWSGQLVAALAVGARAAATVARSAGSGLIDGRQPPGAAAEPSADSLRRTWSRWSK